ncbi:MAG: MBG domain-containing protein [Oscillospiraceae bacterium]
MTIVYNDGDTYTVNYTVAQGESVPSAMALLLNGEAAPESLAVPVPATGSTTLSFEPQLTDQHGQPMQAAITWSHGTLPEGVTVEDGLVTVASTAADGSFTLTATASGLSATITLTLGALKVNWADVDALLAGAAYTYGDATDAIALPEGGTATAVDTHRGSFAWQDGSAVLPAGEARVVVVFTVDESDALYGGVVFEKAYTVHIAQRPIEITIQPAARTYGEGNPAFEAAVTGGTLAGGETFDDLAFTFACGADAASPAGVPVDITGSVANANYTATVLPGQLTIAPADYGYNMQADWLLPAGSGLGALAHPAAGTGVNGEAVAGTFAWYVDAAFTRQATDADIAALPGGAGTTLHWRFTAQNPNYTAEPKTGAAAIAIEADEPVRLVSIGVTTLPTKREYTNGENLSLAGLVVTATYSDGTTRVVDGWTASPANGSKLEGTGTKTITIRYTEDGESTSTTFTVTVKAANIFQQVVTAVVTAVKKVVETVVSWLRRLF